MRRRFLGTCLLGLAVLFLLVTKAEARSIVEGANYGRSKGGGFPGMGVCYTERWKCDIRLNARGGCETIVYLIDIVDRRPIPVGLKAKIWLLSHDHPRKYLMATIGPRSSGVGFKFRPDAYKDCVKFSDGYVKFLIELAPGGVGIKGTRCRYVFRD